MPAIRPFPDVISRRVLEGLTLSDWQPGTAEPPVDGPYQRQLDRQTPISWYRWGAWYMHDVRDVRSPSQDAPWRGLVSRSVA